MKKVLFCLSLIISLSVLGAVPSFAMEFTLDPATIGSIGDLGYGLAGGMELDFNDSFIAAKYKGEYVAAGNSQGKRLVAQKAANDFITNYAISRGLPLPSDASDYVENLPTDTYSYFKSVYFDNQTRSIVNNAKLAGDDQALLSDALRFGIGPSAFADWASYSTFWYNKYMQIGEDADTSNIPNPPAEYVSLINVANANQAYGFYWREAPSSIGGRPINSYPTYNYSWAATDLSTLDFSSGGWKSNDYLMPFDTILTLNIVGSGDSYTGTIADMHLYNGWTNGGMNCAQINYNGYNQPSSLNRNYVNLSNFPESSTHIGTLDNVVSYFCNRFRNINIYCNGDCWALGGDSIDEAPANPIIPSFPDVIDPTSDNPAYTIDLPATDTGEGYFDVTSLFDALVDAIEGALDDDLTTDGILDGTKGLAYEDEAGDAVNDDPIPDDDVIDDSIPDPTGYPNIPVPLPPIQDAFSGTTVLAELVHATDVVMPDELMAVFWGIVFILFIIGLIKVLHK